MKIKHQIVLLSALILSVPVYATTVVHCPTSVSCKTSKPSSCRVVEVNKQTNIKWSVDPGPTNPQLTPGQYNLVSATAAKKVAPGSCIYMASKKRAKSTFVVMVSNKNLRPLHTKKSNWSFAGFTWSCPSSNNYKLLKPVNCPFKVCHSESC